MSRPEYLQCPMTPEIINRIRSEQERYDDNPVAYEQQEQNERELFREEQCDYGQLYNEVWETKQNKNSEEINNLPF